MKRDFLLDFVKAVAILAVVLGHISTPLGSFIFAWHMPVFFIVTGILMKNKSRNSTHMRVFSKKDLLKYGRYYLLFASLGIVAYYAKAIILHREMIPILQTIVGCFIYMDMPHNIHHYGFVLWFLPAFFWAKIVSSFYLRLNMVGEKKIGIFFLICTMVLASFLLRKYDSWNSFYILGIVEGIICSVWMIMGTEVAYMLEYVQKMSIVRACKSFTVIFVGIGLASFVHIPVLNLGGYQVENFLFNGLYSFAMFMLLYVWGRIFQCSNCDRIKCWLSWLSENSIYIMVFHVYTNNIVHELFKQMNVDSWQLKSIASYVLLFVCMFIWDRWCKVMDKTYIKR